MLNYLARGDTMYLYEQYDGNGAYYSLIPNLKKIREYKIKTMEQFDLSELVYCIITSGSKLLGKKEEYDISKLNHTKGKNIHWFNIDYTKSYEEKERIIKNYINGSYVPERVIKVKINDNYSYFVLTNDCYLDKTFPDGTSVYCLEGIIEIPRELYLIHLLEQGRYDLLDHENIDEILPLFDLTLEIVCGETSLPKIRKKELDTSNMILERKRNLENN